MAETARTLPTVDQLALNLGDDEPDDAARTTPTRPPAPAPDRDDERQDDERQDDGEQLALLPGRGRRRSTSVPSEVWAELLDHGPTRARYTAKIWRDQDPEGCWPWLGALSSSGHGKLRAGPGARVVVNAHVFGWQLHHGLIRARTGEDPVVAHRCDEASCQRPDHWELIERTANSIDYRLRRHRAEGALADVRGAAGRATAIRAAIQAGQAAGHDDATIRAAIQAAQAAGLRRADRLL